MKQEIRLNRTGDRPAVFIGEEIAFASTKDTTEETKSNWNTVRVYKAYDIKVPYVVGIAFVTLWIGKRDHYWVIEAYNKEEILRGIANILPEVPELESHIAEQLKQRKKMRIDYEPGRSAVEP